MIDCVTILVQRLELNLCTVDNSYLSSPLGFECVSVVIRPSTFGTIVYHR